MLQQNFNMTHIYILQTSLILVERVDMDNFDEVNLKFNVYNELTESLHSWSLSLVYSLKQQIETRDLQQDQAQTRDSFSRNEVFTYQS